MRGPSPILITAALSLAVLIAAAGVYLGNSIGATTTIVEGQLEPALPRTYLAIRDDDGNGLPDWQDELKKSGTFAENVSSTSASSTPEDPLSSIAVNIAQALYGGYISLKQQGSYTKERGNELATAVAGNIRAQELFVPHTVQELTLSEDASVERALQYRADLRVALLPMVTDDPPEFEYFALYLETKDPAWLVKLAGAAGRYRAAKDNMLAVAVPKAAVPEHLRAVNALGAYADTLGRMSHVSNDALMFVALLKTYNENEEEMLRAFDALAQYYVRTVAQN